MMVSDILRRENIKEDLVAVDKRGVLAEMSALLSDNVADIDGGALLELLLDREKLGSTGIGHGVAVPHAKMKDVRALSIAFARSRRGIDFQSMDGKPVYLFFLIVAPENSTVLHLKVLAAVSRLLKEPVVRERLLKADSAAVMQEIVAEEEARLLKSAAV